MRWSCRALRLSWKPSPRVFRQPVTPVAWPCPPADAEPAVTVLVIGGAGGSKPSYLGQALACERMTVLLVAYFARPDLPAYLGDIRLEYFFAVLESREMHSLPSQHSLLSQACRDEASGDADGDPCT